MKLPETGEMRIRCGVDSVGDYFAKVEVYRGFWGGWKSVKSFWSVSLRTPAQALQMAHAWKAENAPIVLGVVQ
jgi:hypothetical protein